MNNIRAAKEGIVEGYGLISRETLRDKIADREENFTLIEVQSKAEYEDAHLPQSINIPLDDISLMVPRLIPNLYEDLIVYCSGPESNLSEQAADLLVSLGYKNVKNYPGGKSDWIDAGLPIERNRSERAA